MNVSIAPKYNEKSQRGIALLITLAFITVLIATALELNRRVRSTLSASARTRDLLTAKTAASSGVHGAMALLARDKRDTFIDSVQEDWADPLKTSLFFKEMMFPGGVLEVSISDELAKIQVNALVEGPGGQSFNLSQQMLWLNFLGNIIEKHERDGDRNPKAIVDSMKDWIDSKDNDAVTGLNGAESDYYRSLDAPYACANRYFGDPSEIERVKGVSESLYQGGGEKPGISENVTVFGIFGPQGENVHFSGAININTAGAPVLKALLGPDYQDQIKELMKYRLEKSGDNYIHDLSDPEWYKEATGFETAQIEPDLIRLESELFKIESKALVNDVKSKITAVVHRRKDEKTGKFWCKILNWQVE